MKRFRDGGIGKNIRISDESLQKAELKGLIRLAKWLGVLPNKENCRDKDWVQKIRIAIAREEKHLDWSYHIRRSRTFKLPPSL